MPETIRVPQPGDVWNRTRAHLDSSGRAWATTMPVLVTEIHRFDNLDFVVYTDGSENDEVAEADTLFISRSVFYATAEDLQDRIIVSAAVTALLGSPRALEFFAKARAEKPKPEEPPPEHRPTQWELLLAEDD